MFFYFHEDMIDCRYKWLGKALRPILTDYIYVEGKMLQVMLLNPNPEDRSGVYRQAAMIEPWSEEVFGYPRPTAESEAGIIQDRLQSLAHKVAEASKGDATLLISDGDSEGNAVKAVEREFATEGKTLNKVQMTAGETIEAALAQLSGVNTVIVMGQRGPLDATAHNLVTDPSVTYRIKWGEDPVCSSTTAVVLESEEKDLRSAMSHHSFKEKIRIFAL
jgi:hypothetical protein